MRSALLQIGKESIANITGCTDPIDNIGINLKEEILKNMVMQVCVYRSIREINQFMEGLNVLKITDLIKVEPGKWIHHITIMYILIYGLYNIDI